MDSSSEELEHRSRCLSWLICRTKLNAASAPPSPPPDPETKLEPQRVPRGGKLKDAKAVVGKDESEREGWPWEGESKVTR